MSVKPFDPAGSPLHLGINLIEASAGTGKTYTIAMLVLRLVVEFDIPLDKILVVTFTKAATEELKDRIRRRLTEVKHSLATHSANNEATAGDWLSGLSLSRETIKQRLESALLDIDQAGIFTIHGFCQRALKEHALAAGQLFDAELTEDIAAVKIACAADFWRREIQSRNIEEASLLVRDFTNPELLLGSVAHVSEDATVFPVSKSLTRVLSETQICMERAKAGLEGLLIKLEAGLQGTEFKDSYRTALSSAIDSLNGWLNGEILQPPGGNILYLITKAGILDGLNGTRFKTTQTQDSNTRKAEFLAALAIDTTPIDELHAKLSEITVVLRLSFLDYLRTELDKQLEKLNAWTFDNLISHLARALKGERGHYLQTELGQRYQAALIDEFQDTDHQQWHIFSSLFATGNHRLFLVGDPKQAIYKFRGADIYSYLDAQRHAHYIYTLDRNWRSHPGLVTAVNRLFQRKNAFNLPDIDFHPSRPALTGSDGALTNRGEPCPPMMLWQLPESGSKSGFWQPNRNDAAHIVRTAVVNEILDLLNGGYRIEVESDRTGRPIEPRDIAILVRTNRQAKDYQDALRLASVPSILNSIESVFASEEALNLYTLLEAIAHPGDTVLLGQALALNWFGFDGQRLFRIVNHETELDNFVARFTEYYHRWLGDGMMAMMQSLLLRENLFDALSRSFGAERRLTNLQHLMELLQQAIIEQRLGIHKTLDWLKAAITSSQSGAGNSESQQLRLESDGDAVHLLTMHRSKGLEFPIVFCPVLWQSDTRKTGKHPLVKCHFPDSGGKGYRLIVDLGSENLETHQAQSDFEEKAEEIRLAYVALTRAKYRCYVAWANSRTEEKANDSALAGLLELSELTFAGQQARLQTLPREHENVFGYALLLADSDIQGRYRESGNPEVLPARERRRKLHTDWQMSSYTALSSLSHEEMPEFPADKAGETYSGTETTRPDLPPGARTGNVIHELLETIPFSELADRRDISGQRNRACFRYGLTIEQPEVIDELLYRTVTTPISTSDNRFRLSRIDDNRCLKEMPFYLSLADFNTRRLNELLQSDPAFRPLAYKQLQGYLTGFIDLICEYDGRFYILDYKTNSLADYGKSALTQTMREHNYGLQYWIYSVVLHRYLTQRIPGYRYSDHFGGVRYLFVRGMQENIPMNGVYDAEPAAAIIEKLSELFGS